MPQPLVPAGTHPQQVAVGSLAGHRQRAVGTPLAAGRELLVAGMLEPPAAGHILAAGTPALVVVDLPVQQSAFSTNRYA